MGSAPYYAAPGNTNLKLPQQKVGTDTETRFFE